MPGLSPEQVKESRERYGVNVLTPPPKPSMWKLFWTNFKDPMIRILLIALGLSAGIAVYEVTLPEHGAEAFFEPAGILLAILLATVIGFALEQSANRKFDILNQVNDDVAVKVMRGGNVTQVPRKDVVVGDIVILETGDEVPADGELIDSVTMSINESTLTGEPLIRKSHRKEDFKDDVTYPTNHALRGTTVVEGHGVMRVTAVGDSTEYGKVYVAAQIDTGVKTPLTLQLERLGRVISWCGYTVGVLILVGRLLVFDWGAESNTMIETIDYVLKTVMLAVTLIVVSVPEGLPMSVTLSLAMSMRRMLASNNLVRKMHACETMGATTVICTDKTGTLTQNQMRIYRTNFYALGGDGEIKDDDVSKLITEGIAVNSTAFLDTSDSAKAVALGNPTEGALLLWLHDKGIDYEALRKGAPVVEQLPFSTERKYMATVVDSGATGRRLLYVKGAPEIVMSMCRELNGVTPEAVTAQLLQYQQQAMRTLGFAYAEVAEGESVIVDGKLVCGKLSFLGITAISDPVRSDVPAAIMDCLDAGIAVKIVTGDTPGTAKEIGRQVGLWTDADGDENLITGPEFAALSEDEAFKRVTKLKIMSRARPTDKSRLVGLLQGNGEVVAVTGDGTNDAPALNAAQVGLSMGDGTSVAKEASDITIMDNSFASISKAVMWGRSLYQNIQRFILFQLVVNLVACLIVVLGAFTGTESPLTVTQMLWVNLIMDTFAALALASLPPSHDVMKLKPRRTGDFIITRGMLWNILGTGLLFVVVLLGLMQYFRHYDVTSLLQFNLLHFAIGIFDFTYNAGADLTRYELSMFFTVFVFLSFWNLFNAKAFASGHTAFYQMSGSKMFFVTLLLIAGGQVLIVGLGGTMFNVTPIRLTDWCVIIAATSLVMLIPLLCTLVAKVLKRWC